VLQDGRVKIGLEFWFNPVWLLVDETTSSSYCIDSEVNESNISSLNDGELLHKREVLLFCGILRFNDYVRDS